MLWLSLALATLPSGCDWPSADDRGLVIVSPWPAGQRREIEQAFSRWLADHNEGAIAIEWLPLGPNDDLERTVLARRVGSTLGRRPLDVALGGPASCYERLGRKGRLDSTGDAATRGWRLVRRSTLGLAVRQNSDGEPGVALDDPRHDAIAREWAKQQLRGGAWGKRYAGLVAELVNSPRIGWQPGSALAAVARGDADRAPAVRAEVERSMPNLRFSADDGEWPEGAAVLSDARRALARRFLEFLAHRGQVELKAPSGETRGASDDLLADLLGATLVDAQDELWAAWAALRRAGRPARPEAFLTESPPWPPASVEKLLEEESGELLDALAGQVAPDADVRAWLMRSWLAPRRRVDGALLDELAGAVDGRLLREPRFRAWLRAEWTAWARQRYRRVARLAGGRWP